MNLFAPCVVFMAVQSSAAANVNGDQQLRQPKLVQDILAFKKPKEQRVMDAISKFRAEICADMKDEHDKEFASYEKCAEFMATACNPGKDKQMDGDRREITSHEGFCQEFFPKAEKKAREQVDKEDKDEEDKKTSAGPSPAPGPYAVSPGPAPGPKAAVPAPAAGPAPAPASGPAPAPAPSPMGSPAAPVPAPFVPGVSAGKPYGAIEDDEAWYYKKGGKDAGRLHMSEKMRLPAQGYWGKLVEHEDGTTATGDWGHEFGPSAGHESFRAICADHPDNPWCYQQGYHRHKSSSATVLASVLPFACALVVIRAL